MIIKNPKFEISAVSPKQYPTLGLPEIVLVGKSNVGKSSFVNTMINRKSLARTSSEPGKTRQINFYNMDNSFYFVDLPGYDKDNIKIEVEDGYLTVHAATNNETEEKEEGKFVRKERYFGECSRSFYVGEAVETDDVKATFKNGILTLEIPKKEEKKELPEKKYVQIEG